MAVNLISTIMQSLTPDMIAKIAAMLGLNQGLAQKAIAAGIPAILGSFANLASSPDGASQLSRTLSQQSGVLDQLKNVAGGPGQKSFADRGVELLSGLLGRDGVDTLTSAVSANAGIDSGSGKSLLGMLGPLVAGVLGQQQKSSGLDAGGLASLLASQKGQIAAAMPQGLSSQLGGLFDNVGAGLRSGAEAGSATAGRFGRMTEDAVTGTGQAAYAAAKRTPSSLPYWLGGLAALLLGLGWYLISTSPQQQPVAEQSKTSSSTVGTAPANVSAASLTNQMSSLMGSLTTDLQQITDSASARTALPKLQQRVDQLDSLNKLAGQLPPDVQKGLAAPVAASMPALNELCDKILAIPGVAAFAKPTIDALRTKLEAITRA